MYGVFAPNFHSNFIKFHPKITFSSFFHETLLESLRDSHSPGQEFHFFDSKITHFHFFIRVRRFGSKSSSRSHKMVSNDPILDSKVVTDELGQLGRPAERAGRAWPARAGQPGRPVPPAGRWAALRGEGEKREGQRRGAAHRPNPAPPLLSPQVGYLV